ncbi:MAG: Tat pathway signal protein [Holophagales bacterium]|nr:Tat pathway signal protein [Holophagales bacterium]
MIPRPAFRTVATLLLASFAAGCGNPSSARAGSVAVAPARVAPVAGGEPIPAPPRVLDPLVDELERRTFQWFWDTANPRNGLVPDRWPAPSFSSVAAVGFGLSAYVVGAERGWVTREEARDRVLLTLRFLWNAPQGPSSTEASGYRGFFYHFLDMETGKRWAKDVELSSIDTTLCLSGALVAGRYFNRDDLGEAEIRDLATKLYERVDWRWMQPRPARVAMAWYPEKGFGPADWNGYDESMILYVLALGSPTHPATDGAWEAFCSTYRWAEHEGQNYVNFAPLFGHQFSHAWIDFRGIQDAYMRQKGIDYFENSRRALLAQRAYAIRNPEGYLGYTADVWGLSASDGPADVTRTVDGRVRRFLTYGARGVSSFWSNDDGTITPMATAASLPFAPEVVLPAMKEMKRLHGEHLWGTYGFLDSFNPTFRLTDVPTPLGKVVPDAGWYATNYVGINQGPMVLMIENQRSGLLWRLMKQSPPILAGLRRAGFTGGWLDAAPQP